MNKVIITGKITRIKPFEKVTYATICTRSNNEYEFIPVTIFNTDFFNRYFYEKKWITVEGHIHINQYENNYTTEIIADNLHFAGDSSEVDKGISDLIKQAKGIEEVFPDVP